LNNLHSPRSRVNMLADLDLALKQPLQLVQKLFNQNDSTLDGFEDRVESTFQSLLNDARDQVSSLHYLPGTITDVWRARLASCNHFIVEKLEFTESRFFGKVQSDGTGYWIWE